MPLSAEQFAKAAPIHPDSLSDYKVWETLLRKWNARINLVAPHSLPDFWQRHALDSAQILPHFPATVRTIVDFGSGAGFPALSIAIEMKHRKQAATVHLIESAGKKASFLKSVSRETSLNTQVHADRIERIDPLNAHIITARAFAPLHRLLPLASRHLSSDGFLILLKGESVQDEINEVSSDWSFEAEAHPSLSDETGFVLILRNLTPK